jgi:uncharacterized membrane protein
MDMQKELGMKAPAAMGRHSLFTTRELTVVGMLTGITMLLGLTGYGFIPLPAMKATILHVPVIIGALVAGPRVGAMVGFLFGIFSLWQAIMAPTILSFAFLNPLISIVPRVIIGIGSYYVFVACCKFLKKPIAMGVAAVAGSLVFNTGLVMGGIYLIYAKDFALAMNISVDAVLAAVLAICATNGIPEAIVSAAIVVPVVMVLKKVVKGF